MDECKDLVEVRERVDAIDRRIVGLLSERIGFIEQAARLKSSPEEIEVPERVEEVVRNVRVLAEEQGMSPSIAETVYRVMIASFIEYEMQAFLAGRGSRRARS